MKSKLSQAVSLGIQILQKLVSLPRPAKFALILTLDALLCVAAVLIAFSLRFGYWDLWTPAIATVTAAALILWLPIFLLRGIYRSIVRFMGSRTMTKIASSCLLMGVGLAAFFTIDGVPGIPRTVAFIHPLVFATLLMMSRLTARYVFFDLLSRRRFVGQHNRVLVYGAGSAGRQLAASLHHEPGMVLLGYIDDDPRLRGQHLDGVRIHAGSDILRCIQRYEIDTILLAIPRLSRAERKRVVQSFKDTKVHVLTLPNMREIVDGKISVNDLREIEIADLLGRDPVPPDRLLLHKTVQGRIVMVTGAGGSIGSELCRQIVELNPSKLILVEMTEHALYAIDAELQEAAEPRISGGIEIIPELANVADHDTVRRLFARWSPDTVFHAAAYKHVPLVEENAISGMRNNIFGTLYCALEAERNDVCHFILISTDKAVRPTNVMGSSKRVCELVLQALADRQSGTRFAMVRFGNVLGSSGSVVPRFQSQIRRGGPVTLTHRDVTRYFMTIPEAAQLVVQAGAMAEGGEVFVLDMGEPIRVYDLARTMIGLSGASVRDAQHPGGDIEIIEVGLRPGEKLYEELLIGNAPRLTQHPRIMRAREAMIVWSKLEPQLEELRTAIAAGDREGAIRCLRGLVPEYIPRVRETQVGQLLNP
ncbi:MAG: polysaccharide biosynthesis protein [Alphaproteobacteria bacterium]|nr:MAG: polysaccharide biosynthesis protein [Alphaproteobacteria bacterium]